MFLFWNLSLFDACCTTGFCSSSSHSAPALVQISRLQNEVRSWFVCHEFKSKQTKLASLTLGIDNHIHSTMDTTEETKEQTQDVLDSQSKVEEAEESVEKSDQDAGAVDTVAETQPIESNNTQEADNAVETESEPMEIDDDKNTAINHENETKVDEGDEDDVDDEDESGDDGMQASEPLATTRSRRSNAGNRMSNLIQEEEDDFYKNLYGGFYEEDDDGDFDSDEDLDQDEVEEDYDVDSDFSIDETDEIAPQHQIEEEETRKKKSVYREPKAATRAQHTPIASNNLSASSVQTRAPKPTSSTPATPHSPNKQRERSFRDSTRKKRVETIKNIETGKKKRKFRNVEPHKQLTQEEMLEEAKKTEEENIRSLEIYQRLESEKLEKIKKLKKSLPTPYVSYYSSIFTNPETKEKYSRNLCTYVGCEPEAKTVKASALSSRSSRARP